MSGCGRANAAASVALAAQAKPLAVLALSTVRTHFSPVFKVSLTGRSYVLDVYQARHSRDVPCLASYTSRSATLPNYEAGTSLSDTPFFCSLLRAAGAWAAGAPGFAKQKTQVDIVRTDAHSDAADETVLTRVEFVINIRKARDLLTKK